MPDLFISYAHVDKPWVDVFVPLLEQQVNRQVGRVKPDRIWKDNRFASNMAVTPEIEAQLEQAACLVSVLSPGYLASKWCLYELNRFSERVGANSRCMFSVELDQIAQERKPAAISELLGSRFWRQDPLSKRTYTLNPDEHEFGDRLTDLAKDIAAVLAPPVDPTIGAVIVATDFSTPDKSRTSSTPLCKRGAGGDFYQQKRTDLEKRYARLQELLSRQQEELDFTDDPKRQMKLEHDIQKTQTSLQQVEAELCCYQSPHTGL